ncbi:hypothetical protein AVEN_15265-1 [Araneus ventricosus]|uniref:Uncharacterized protein n=1 Tax=Araneus ventricosus TaxID=182803 RepID=A0A4Y2K2T8_ARAVE|nr:hypothetical protein AVEN_15265-1 [Araneus ventricosus]
MPVFSNGMAILGRISEQADDEIRRLSWHPSSQSFRTPLALQALGHYVWFSVQQASWPRRNVEAESGFRACGASAPSRDFTTRPSAL